MSDSVLDTYCYHYKLVSMATLCSLTYLSTIQKSIFIEFRVNIKYGNDLITIQIFNYN
jgi:hypothetical protein